MTAASKIAMVTGAGTGIGKAVSLALLNAGYAVVLTGRRKEMLDGTAKEAPAGAKTLVFPADVSDPGAGESAVRQDPGGLRPPRRAVQQCRHRRAALDA